MDFLSASQLIELFKQCQCTDNSFFYFTGMRPSDRINTQWRSKKYINTAAGIYPWIITGLISYTEKGGDSLSECRIGRRHSAKSRNFKTKSVSVRLMDRKSFVKTFFSDLLKGVDIAFGDELSAFAEKFPELTRPPGAGSEQEFLETCSKCGNCIRACPYFALKPVLMASEFDRGTPALRVGEAFCRFCPEFPCVAACPTGALSKQRQDRLRKIGNATIIVHNCVRSQGNDCRACLDKCAETGNCAIKIVMPAQNVSEFNFPEIITDKCSGCGACLTVCPAYPDPAISLKPLP